MAGSTILKSVFPRNVFFHIGLFLLAGVVHHFASPQSFFAQSRSRAEWVQSLNDDDDAVQFVAVGPSSRTLLVVLPPQSSRVYEDVMMDEILYSADEFDFRKELVSRGFEKVQVDGRTKALPSETRKQDSQVAAASSGKV